MAQAVKTTCPYCGVGCGVVIERDQDGNVSVRGDSQHPANLGRLCSKGSALAETIGPEERLLEPEISGHKADWDEALDLVAEKFAQTICDHGPDSVAFYVSGQLLTEDYYVANKLMKGFIGSANIDTNSRLCMASSVAGHRRAFGSDTVPGTYEDLELADLVVLTGTNTAWCHPVLYQRIAAAKSARPQMRVVLIDPRRTMTAQIADLHLPIAPDSDVALFGGLLRWLIEHAAVDADYVSLQTAGFAEASRQVACLTSRRVAEMTGVEQTEIERFYRLFAQTEKVVTAYSQGVNQSSMGTDKVNAIINCHLATGRIGRPGMGPFSFTGQPNAMGGREVGGLANMLAAHMEIEKPHHRDIVSRFWQAPNLAERPGLKAVDLFRAVGEGKVKALWIMGTNPVDSMPEADGIAAALEKCEFVVVSDVVANTDTIRYAHVRLPSAAWGEKDGTVTNSERRISRQRAFLKPPGQARPDWWQMAQVARRMGFSGAFDWSGPAEIFAEHAALTAFENDGSRDLDIGAFAGVDPSSYAGMQPFQWPMPKGAGEGTERFFATGGFFTEDKRARFIPTTAAPPVRTTQQFPLVLNTGRVRDHWHTMTRTGRSQRLSSHIAEPYVEMNPADAGRLGIGDADVVVVESEKGKVVVRALLTDRQRPGSVFVPMHWTDQFSAKARIDTLVPSVTDPHSSQPASKHVAVRVERMQVAVFGLAVSRSRPDPAGLDYWALGRIAGGWRMEFAHREQLGNPLELATRFLGRAAVDACDPIQFVDARRNVQRLAMFAGDSLQAAIYAGPQSVAVSRTWAIGQLGESHADRTSRWRVVAGRPAGDMPDKGRIVCSCFNVGANEIRSAIRSGAANVDSVGKTIQAGTNCGSCRAEIKEILDEHRPIAAE